MNNKKGEGANSNYETIGKELERELSICKEKIPCDYHRRKENNKDVRPIYQVIDEDSENIVIALDDNLRRIIGKLYDNDGPAGSWGFMKEQREWFLEQLRKYSEQKEQNNYQLGIAGIAGPAHFNQTRELITKELPGTDLYIIERCIYPLRKIADIIRKENYSLEGKIVDQVGDQLSIHETYVRKDEVQDKESTIRLINADLTKNSEYLRKRELDIITAHFLLSFVDPKKVSRIISNFYNLLRTEGKLIMAQGRIKGIDDLTKQIINQGFELKEIKQVADFYDLSKEQIEQIKNKKTESIVLPKQNSLMVFEKIE